MRKALLLAPFILVFLAGLFNGGMDSLQSRYASSFFAKLGNDAFWNPQLSWRAKWKDGEPAQGERFFLSSTSLAGLTDGWHLLKSCWLACVFLAACAAGPAFAALPEGLRSSKLKVVALLAGAFFALFLAHGLAFELVYRLNS